MLFQFLLTKLEQVVAERTQMPVTPRQQTDLALWRADVVNGKIFTNYELNKAKIHVFVAMTPQDFIETIFDPYGRRTHLDYQLSELTISCN